MKLLLTLMSLVFTMTLSFNSRAQIFFTEDFEGAMNPGTDLPSGWTETGLSTDGIWSTGDEVAASSAYVAVPAPLQGTNFAYSNDDACNCDKSVDYMILPTQNFTTYAGVNLIMDVFNPGGYGSIGTVEVSVDGGATWTVVFTFNEDAAWQDDVTVSLNAYAGLPNVLVSIRYNDNANWAYAIAIDDVRLEELASIDMTVTNPVYDYTIIPFSQVAPIALSSDVANVGSFDAADAALTVNVYELPNVVTPVQTTSSTPTLVTAGSSANFNAGTFTPTATGTYIMEYITTATGDANATNDTAQVTFIVSDDIYARDDGNVVFNAGIGAGPVGYLGTMFEIVNTASVDSVLAAFTKPGASGAGAGDSTRYVVFNVAGGLPTTIIGESDAYIFTPADTNVFITRTLEIQANGGGPLTLTPGTYFFAVEENNTNVGLSFTDDNFRLNTHYFSWTNQAWAAAETFPVQFQRVPVIRPILGCGLTATSSTTDATCTASDGSATVTPSGVAPYTILWDTGATTTTLSGVAAGTYTYTVTDNVGCTYTDSATIATNSIAITGTTSTTDATCGNPDGTATVTPTNGAAPYTYSWSNGATTATAIGLAAGSYTVTVTDANGCTGTLNATVVDLGAPSITAQSVDVSCYDGTNGSIDITVTGGTPPYSFSWSNGATTEDLTGIPAGSYTGTVTDDAGCTAVGGPIVINEPDSIAPTAAATDVSVAGGSDGSIDLTVTGGTAPYTYSWDNGATTEDISGLMAGTYVVTITDANGCTATLSVEVMDGPASIATLNANIGELNLFPNPASTQVALELELTQVSDVKVELTNLNGQVLSTQHSTEVTKVKFDFDVTGWAPGIYLVKVQTESGSSTVRFVKQ